MLPALYKAREFRRAFWSAFLLVAVLGLREKEFVARLSPPVGRPHDFFQEWASAKNVLRGLPAYTCQDITVPLYLHQDGKKKHNTLIQYNAHPPVAVLLGLPFTELPYHKAHFAWNLVSLLSLALACTLILRAVAPQTPTLTVAVLMVVLLGSRPVFSHLRDGQLSMLLLLLLTLVWLADRSDRSIRAGLLLGLATAIKFQPGLLFLYFLLRRRWRVVSAGVYGFLSVNFLTLLILGPNAFRDYWEYGYPEVLRWRTWEGTYSLMSFWSRLFDSGPLGSYSSYFMEPLLAKTATILSSLIVLGLLVGTTRGPKSRDENDMTFGLYILALLPLSPLLWDHYFLMALLPLALIWSHSKITPRMKAISILLTVGSFGAVAWGEQGLSWLGLEKHVNPNVWAFFFDTLQLFLALGQFVLGLVAVRMCRVESPVKSEEDLCMERTDRIPQIQTA